jgi:Ca2+-binding EF-hand superfamily protein/thiol-disulfide isomerase/thioredoxin
MLSLLSSSSALMGWGHAAHGRFRRPALLNEAACSMETPTMTVDQLRLDECLSEPGVIELTSLESFNEHVRSSTRCCSVVVVKFFKDRCRSCLALKPKFDAMAAEYTDAAFYEVNVARGRSIFDQEQVKLTPSVLIYCGHVGRINGLGASKQLALDTRAQLKVLMRGDRSRACALAAVGPEAMDPFLLYADVVDALRAIRRSETLLDGVAGGSLTAPIDAEVMNARREIAAGAVDAAVSRLSLRERADLRALFSHLDRRRAGEISIDDLVTITNGLAPCDSSDVCMRSASMFAPSRLAAAGVLFEYRPLGSRLQLMRSVCSSTSQVLYEGGEQQATRDPPAAAEESAETLGPSEFIGLMALYAEDEAKKSSQPLVAKFRAAFAVLDAEGSGGVPIATAAERLAASLRPVSVALSHQEAIEEVLAAFDLEGTGVVTGIQFERMLARTPQMSPLDPEE